MSDRIQSACETLESLLERDSKEKILTIPEFMALNTVLLEMAIKCGYKVKGD